MKLEIPRIENAAISDCCLSVSSEALMMRGKEVER
jgi:hypothetical protein